jgi:hypothetical protein
MACRKLLAILFVFSVKPEANGRFSDPFGGLQLGYLTQIPLSLRTTLAACVLPMKGGEWQDKMNEPHWWYEGFLDTLSPRVREKLLSLGESFRYPAGEVVFREGDASHYLYLVKSGRVGLEIHLPARGSRTVLVVGPGELFSWSAMVEPRIETASARTMEETEVLRIKAGTLVDVSEEDPEFGLQLYRRLAEVISARLVATRRNLLDEIAWPEEAIPREPLPRTKS